MIKALKSYWAFTNDWYKLVMLVIVPILLIVLNCLFFHIWDAGDFLLVSLFVLYFIDAILDSFFMGGFYRKNNGALEFLQTSPRFAAFMKEIVLVDIVRRVLLYQIPFVTTLVCAMGDEYRLEWCSRHSFLPLFETLIAMLAIFVSRHFLTLSQAYATVMIGYMIILFCLLFLIMACAVNPWLVNGILVVCILLAGIATVWYTDKKVRASYYDA